MALTVPSEFPVRERLRVPGWLVAVRSDIGARRERLEDAWRVLPQATFAGRPVQVFALFDGLGGEPFGQEAAWSAADHLPEAIEKSHTIDHLLPYLNGWVRQTQGSTTAVVAVLPQDGTDGWITSVGDSAAYALNDLGELALLNPKDSAGSNVVTRCLGQPSIEAHVASLRVGRGRVVALCSDGVDEVAGRPALEPLFRAPDLAAAVDDLFATVWANGAPDNATIVAARRTG